MSKSDDMKLEQARRDGMSYALRVAKEKGIDGLEAEIAYRGYTNIPISISHKTADAVITAIKHQTCDCFQAMSVLSLLDLYKTDRYAVKMAKRFKERFNYYSTMLVDEKFTWQDVVDELYDRGLAQEIRLNDVDQINSQEDLFK